MGHKVNFLSGVQLASIQSFLSPRQVRLTILNKHSLTDYLIIGERRTDRFDTFPWARIRSEVQTASSKILTLVTDFISYDDNHYTKQRLRLKLGGKHFSGNLIHIADVLIKKQLEWKIAVFIYKCHDWNSGLNSNLPFLLLGFFFLPSKKNKKKQNKNEKKKKKKKKNKGKKISVGNSEVGSTL